MGNFEYHGSISLPSTLENYSRHRHSTGSCHDGSGNSKFAMKICHNTPSPNFKSNQNQNFTIGRIYQYTNKIRPTPKNSASQSNSGQCDRNFMQKRNDNSNNDMDNDNSNDEKSNSEQNLL